jgi:transposase
MLWELSVTEQRYRAVPEVRAGVPVTEVAERYGVSRQRVHAWLRRYRDEGPSGLADRSHKVHHHPWQIPPELEAAICEMRRTHPKWGPRRLVFEMDRCGHGIVTRSTVYRALVRNGLIEPKSRKRRRRDYKRWERPVPMELWQLDVTASAFLASGREVKNGITQRLTRPASPTTTGKIERLHKSLQDELLDDHGSFESLEALQAALDAWRQEIQHRPAAPVPEDGLPRLAVRLGHLVAGTAGAGTIRAASGPGTR